MEPTNLKAIARDAALRGDTKTLFHTLDLLERVVPIATFMDFCTKLDEFRLRGRARGPLSHSGRGRGYIAARYAYSSAFHRALPAVTCRPSAVRHQLDL